MNETAHYYKIAGQPTLPTVESMNEYILNISLFLSHTHTHTHIIYISSSIQMNKGYFTELLTN